MNRRNNITSSKNLNRSSKHYFVQEEPEVKIKGWEEESSRDFFYFINNKSTVNPLQSAKTSNISKQLVKHNTLNMHIQFDYKKNEENYNKKIVNHKEMITHLKEQRDYLNDSQINKAKLKKFPNYVDYPVQEKKEQKQLSKLLLQIYNKNYNTGVNLVVKNINYQGPKQNTLNTSNNKNLTNIINKKNKQSRCISVEKQNQYFSKARTSTKPSTFVNISGSSRSHATSQFARIKIFSKGKNKIMSSMKSNPQLIIKQFLRNKSSYKNFEKISFTKIQTNQQEQAHNSKKASINKYGLK